MESLGDSMRTGDILNNNNSYLSNYIQIIKKCTRTMMVQTFFKYSTQKSEIQEFCKLD